MTQHGYIGKHVRAGLRQQLAHARREVEFDHRHERTPAADRTAYLVAEELWRNQAVAFANLTLDGHSATTASMLRVMCVVRRYRDVCSLAYLGPLT